MSLEETKSKELQAIITNLSADESDTRRWAVYDLEQFPPEHTLEHLVNGIQDEHRAVREAAAEVLESIPPQLWLRKLTPLLGSPRIEIRNLVAALIAKFGDATVEYLLEALADENEDVRKFSADILGLAESEKAVEGLVAALYDPVENVGVSVAEALGKIKSPLALPHLIKAFETRDYLKRECAEGIGMLGLAEGAHFLMDQLLPIEDLLIQFAIVDALGNAGDLNVLEFLEKNFKSLPEPLQEPVIMGMLKIASREDIRLLSRSGLPLDIVTSVAQEADEDFQQLFIEQIDETVPVDVLSGLVTSREKLNTRVLVALVKAAEPHSEVHKFILDMVDHKDDWVSYTAIEQLERFEPELVTDVLKTVLAGDRNLPQLAAMKIIQRLDLSDAREMVAPFLESDDEDLRAMAEQVTAQ